MILLILNMNNFSSSKGGVRHLAHAPYWEDTNDIAARAQGFDSLRMHARTWEDISNNSNSCAACDFRFERAPGSGSGFRRAGGGR